MDQEMTSGRIEGLSRDEEMYGMRPLRSVDSREQIISMAGQAPKSTRSGKTTESEPIEAVPKHVLYSPSDNFEK
jgi:hypothetical protein